MADYILTQVLTNTGFFIIGLVLIIKGADWITTYGSRLAKKLGASELVIGLTLVAFATSLPELAVSMFSVFLDVGEIATGTIIGSNISNVTLILGLSAIAYPLATGRSFYKEGFVTLGFSLLVAFFLLNGMQWYEGIIILALFFSYLLYDLRSHSEEPDTTIKHIRSRRTAWKYAVYCILSGILIVVGAQLLTTSTVTFAELVGVPEIMIAMLIIAVGTSLPELATSVTAALKKMRGISLGNIIGSNIFNIAILGIVSLFKVVPVTSHVVNIDLPVMVMVTALLLLVMRIGWKISRKEGLLLLFAYISFVALQFI